MNALWLGLKKIEGDVKDLWDGIGGIASRTLGLLRYGEFSNSSDYNMTDDEYSEWMKYKNEQAAKGIEVANGKFDMRDMVEYGSLKYYEAKSVLDDDIIFVTKTEGKGKTAISYTGGVVDPNATKTVFDAVRFDKDGNSIASEFFKANVEGLNRTTNDGTVEYTNELFAAMGDAADFAGMGKSQKLNFVTDTARYHYSDMKFADQSHLNYTFGSVMENLGIMFDYSKANGMKYDYNTLFDWKTDEMNKGIMNVDCVTSTSVGVYIMGFTKDGYSNLNCYGSDYAGGYETDKGLFDSVGYKPIIQQGNVTGAYTNAKNKTELIRTPESLIGVSGNGVKNMLSNQIFDVFEFTPNNQDDPKSVLAVDHGISDKIGDLIYKNLPETEITDYTGMMGITEKPSQNLYSTKEGKYVTVPSYVDHIYTYANQDGTDIVQSEGGSGWRVDRDGARSSYAKRTRFIMQLHLNSDRKYK